MKKFLCACLIIVEGCAHARGLHLGLEGLIPAAQAYMMSED